MDTPIEIFLSLIAFTFAMGVIGLWKKIPIMLFIAGAVITFWAIMTDNIQLGFAEPTSINSIREDDIDQYSQLTRTGALTLRNGSNIFIGERLNSVSSVLYNKDIDEVCLALGKTGTPLGTATIAIYNTLATPTTLNAIYTFGTIDVSTLPTTGLATYCFEHTATNQDYSLFLNVAFGIFYNGGSSGNNVNVDVSASNPFDGSNTLLSRYQSSWTNDSTQDTYGLARLNIIVEDTENTTEPITFEFTEYPKILFGIIGAIIMLAGAMIWKYEEN